mgnify:CR=1 FL=1
MRTVRSLARFGASGLLLAQAVAAYGQAADVDNARLLRAERDRGNWLMYGRTYEEQRFSPLDAINDRNVSELGLAWYLDLGTHRGLEATPLVIDGVLYTTSSTNRN